MRHLGVARSLLFASRMSGQNFFAFAPLKPLRRTTRAVLLLALEVVLIVPSCLSQKIDAGQKSADKYWAESGLGSRELELLLAPKSCLQDHRHYLGCVNAISAMVERYDLVLDQNGQLSPMTPEAIEKRLTEKKELSTWEQKLAGEEANPEFSFLDLWKKIDQTLVRPNERSAVIGAGINGFLSITKDPHSYILPLSYYEEIISRSDTRPTHLGFISKRVKGGAFVRKVFAGSPAAVAGLRKGDRILEVNGQVVTTLHPAQYSEIMKVKTGGRIGLKIERTEGPVVSQRYLDIIKTDATYPNVLSKILSGHQNVGLITIHKFAQDTCRMVKTNLISLKEEGLRGLILDLRDNPGGQVDEAACILNLFIEKGQLLFETRYLDPTHPVDTYRADRDPIFQGPLTILINGGSASASEIVAGSLKDLGRATLVGERSFGKGTFQDGRLWGADPRVAFFETEGLYYFPSGWTPQLVGLEPDIKVVSREDESFREEDLYYHPIRPADLWDGPQGLSWMANEPCTPQVPTVDEDPQILKAWAMINCDVGGIGHDRHGTL